MVSDAPRPIWRSLLFVPVHVERFVAKAHLRGADAIILDLEDSVPVAVKDEARGLVAKAAKLVARGGADVVVRINRPLRMAIRDLEAVIVRGVHALALPKVESADHVRLLSETVAELERERGLEVGSVRFIPMIETVSAMFTAREIAAADPRVSAITLGAEDFSLSAGMLPEPEGLMFPTQRVALAARAAGVTPLGFVASIAEYADLEAFRETIRQSRRLGFEGAMCIHPSQVAILNEEHRLTAEQVAYARRVIEAYDDAIARGVGAIELDGKMVDVPIVERSRQQLRRHEVILERESANRESGGEG